MKRIIKDPFFCYFFICLVLATAPYIVWHVKVVYFTFFSYFILKFWGVERSALLRISLLMISCFYICAFINFYGNMNIFGRILYLSPMFLYFVRGNVWKDIYNVFWKFYAYALIPSLLVYFIVVFGNIDLPSFIIEPYNVSKDYNYTAYPFLVISNELSDYGIQNYRFCGYFDEPGVIGTMSGVLLFVNRCNLKDWKNWPILLSGIFSFSLFFYLLLLFCIFVWGQWKYKIGIGVLVVVVVAYLFTLEDNLFKDLILTRLTIEDGEWVGNNRTNESFELFYNNFVESNNIWFGLGTKYSSTVVDPSGASYKYLIVDHGLIPFFLYVLGVVLYYFSIRGFSKKSVVLVFLFLSILFQRQFLVFGLQGVFMILSPCYAETCSNTQNVSEDLGINKV